MIHNNFKKYVTFFLVCLFITGCTHYRTSVSKEPGNAEPSEKTAKSAEVSGDESDSLSYDVNSSESDRSSENSTESEGSGGMKYDISTSESISITEPAAGQEVNLISEGKDVGSEAKNTSVDPDFSNESDSTDPYVESLLSGMTLEEKVAQLFFITPESLTGIGQVIQTGATSKEAFSKYPVGGIVYFSQNLETPDQTKQMIRGLSDFALTETGIPLFLSVDEEGGRVTRFAKNPTFQIDRITSMKIIGESGDFQKAYDTGAYIGQYLYEYGINLDFAPDADVLLEPSNTVIGDRSFGSDPNLVADMASAYAEGLKSQHVLACYKHFPGHGGTKEDTHKGYAYSYKTLDELMKDELIPFYDAAKKKIPMIMVAHISLPAINGDDTPASLSEFMVTEVLRNKLLYEGVIITDALDMGAVKKHYSVEDACRKALLAGNDMLLMSGDFRPGYEAILQDVKSGVISEARIDESVRRILNTKKQLIS